jgi:hypothetical protein
MIKPDGVSREAWDELMNAPTVQPGHVYVEHDDEDHTGEWMDGRQVNALVRSLRAQPSSRDEEVRESIKLAMADALACTEADDPALNEDALDALLEGGQLLRDGATEQQEGAWLGRLLVAGFNLAPTSDQQPETTSGGER